MPRDDLQDLLSELRLPGQNEPALIFLLGKTQGGQDDVRICGRIGVQENLLAMVGEPLAALAISVADAAVVMDG